MPQSANPLRNAIRANHRRSEAELAAVFLAAEVLTPEAEQRAAATAADLIRHIRDAKQISTVDALMRQYDLSSDEGLTMMELAEALLRIPDAATRDSLIRDKIGDGDWERHAGQSSSFFVNLSTWGLTLGARLLDGETALGRIVGRLGAPVMRTAIGQAMRLLGDRFVFAETIGDALKRAGRERQDTPLSRHSFDMLGEAARTEDDARRYFAAYSDAIAAIAAAAWPGPMADRPGISIKLSALNPRYELTRADAVRAELLPVLVRLAEQAAKADISFTLDAEEADRLDLSLDLFESLACHPALAAWQGLGLAVQAYSRRTMPVIDWVIDLARRSNRRIMVRLVKGAYWDTEIKRAQQEGLDDYPVFTRKAMTDLSYLVAAQKLLSAGTTLYPMFATHNAYTVAAVRELARDLGRSAGDFEFQRLHGMGDQLYEAAAAWQIPCRTYAPVGPHRDLLAYLVRRLLENGANSSFVNQIADRSLKLERLVESPQVAIRSLNGAIHNPRLPTPTGLYGQRPGAPGVDFGDPDVLHALSNLPYDAVAAVPLIDGRPAPDGQARMVISPADHRTVAGTVTGAQIPQVTAAARSAAQACGDWSGQPASSRALILERAAGLLTAERDRFLSLLVREGGRTIRNAVGEWREAIDFLRYYAAGAERLMTPLDLSGPTGETNTLTYAGKGVFVCISPWNFPLSIFLGQIAAALATGNAVLAKPAPETPLIGFIAVDLLHRAGVPGAVLQYLPGGGDIGAALVAEPEIAGVVFTGSTATGRQINRTLASKDGPIATLIAETGGQNAMIVDSSALIEQAVGDIVASAFDSAGQRCSALRLLAVQDDIAEALLTMVQGAMAALTLGDPARLSTDIGPMIHERARAAMASHMSEISPYGRDLSPAVAMPVEGSFFAPRLIEIDRIDRLTHEVFGPILHVVRWKAGELENVIAGINALGFGLTLGIETRIDDHVRLVRRLARVGNIYVNRSQIGAVVESQPFGGEGLSGTGPKAGGPHYLTRFVTERVTSVNTAASGGNVRLLREQ